MSRDHKVVQQQVQQAISQCRQELDAIYRVSGLDDTDEAKQVSYKLDELSWWAKVVITRHMGQS